MPDLASRLRAAALALAGLVALAQPADAAGIRRHLDCATLAGGGVSLPIVNVEFAGLLNITNSSSQTIPAGTTYSYTVAGHRASYTHPQPLASGETIAVGDAAVTANGMACDVWFEDPRFQLDTDKLHTIQNAPGLTLQAN
jgi:hypothetical protein